MLNAFAHTTVVQNTAVDLGGQGSVGTCTHNKPRGELWWGFRGALEMPNSKCQLSIQFQDQKLNH